MADIAQSTAVLAMNFETLRSALQQERDVLKVVEQATEQSTTALATGVSSETGRGQILDIKA
ncbi:MAG: hypothetical protein OQJ99_04430 [Rhodospirillales bacterium]|nr:hypothetical protein [Rhodospirillales bacterium]MCW8863117.1 hypothetical protein [Rhodospirillales bacterium]MCW8951210.1 hypothetical protein [Rhodospirillales bacterium]